MHRRTWKLAALVVGAVLVGASTPAIAEPTSVRQWQSVGPNASGGDLAFTRAMPARLYVLPPTGRHVYRTDDRGRSWRAPVDLGVKGGYGRQLAADPRDPNLVYVAVAPQGGDHGSVLRSRDGAKTFQPVFDTPAGFTSVVVSRTGQDVFVGGDEGVFASSDHGANWKVIPGSPTGVRQLGLDDRDLLIGTGNGIHLIENATGKPSAPRKLPVNLSVDTLAVGTRVAVAAGIFGGAVLSTDHGRTWREVTGPWNRGDAIPFIGVGPAGDVQLQSVAGSADGSGKRDLWVSRDAGRTWQAKPAFDKVDLYTEVGSFPDRPDVQVVSASAGIFTTRDSVEFERIGVPETTVAALTVAGPALIAGTPTGSYRSTAPLGREFRAGYQDWGWTGRTPATIGNSVGALQTLPGKGSDVLRARNTYCPGDCFAVERSTDGGRTWQGQTALPGNSRSLVVDPRDPAKVYAGGYLAPGVYSSVDGGNTFALQHEGRLTGVLEVAVDRRGELWIADVSGLYLSSDGVLTKVLDGQVEAVAVDPADPLHVVVAGDGFVKVTRDSGKTFTDGKDAPAIYYTDVAFGRDGTVFAASRDMYVPGQGVLRSTDGGKRWAPLPTQPVDHEVRTLLVSPDGDWLFAGTMGSGVHRLALR